MSLTEETNVEANVEADSNYEIAPYDIVKYMATRLQLFIIGLLLSIIIFVQIKNKSIHWSIKTIIITAPLFIAFFYYWIVYAPKPIIPYLKNKLSGQHAIETGFYHKKGPGDWPFLGSCVIEINGKSHVFLGGGQGQDDVLMLYDDGTFTNIINKYNIRSKDATYSAVSFDMNGNGSDDLIVGRSDGVFMYERISNNKFKKHQIFGEIDAVPLAITIGDVNKNGKPDIYISYFTLMKKYRGSVFNDPTHDRQNVLLLNECYNKEIKFTDATKKMNAGGKHNTFTSAFIDLDNSGYPDLVLSHDSGEIEILKNMDGKRFISTVPYPYKGNWMGLGVGDVSGNGYMDLFLTNLGSDTLKDKVSVGDLIPGQKLTFSHVLLQNNGDHTFQDITQNIGTGFGWGAVIDDLDLTGKENIIFAENFILNPLNWIYPGTGYQYETNDDKFLRKFKYNNPYFGQTPLLVDLNDNGIKDIVWVNVRGPTIAYINKTKNNYVSIKLPKTIEFANSKLLLTNSNNKKMHKQIIHGGIGFGSGQTDLVTFGLGQSNLITSDTYNDMNIIIKTNYGKVYMATNVKINSRLTLKDFINE
jgi:hypothetical protein